MPHHLEKPLDFKEELFVLEYISCRSYKQAGEAVGLTPNEVHLLTKRKAFHEAVEHLSTTVLGRAEVTAQSIVDELASIAYDKTGDVKHGDRIRALELLGKWRNIKLFSEVVEVDASDTTARVKPVELEERIRLMETSRDPSLLESE